MSTPCYCDPKYLHDTIQTSRTIQPFFNESLLHTSIHRKHRPNAEQVVIMATDADYHFDQHDDTKAASQVLQDQGIVIYAIGSGQWLNPGNTEAIATHYAIFSIWEKLLFQDTPYTSYTPGE